MFTCDFSTTVSIANPPEPDSSETVGAFIAGSIATTASRDSAGTFILSSTFVRASSVPDQQGVELVHCVTSLGSDADVRVRNQLGPRDEQGLDDPQARRPESPGRSR